MTKPVAIQLLDEKEVDPSPNNPRKNFPDKELNELADSIFQQGILQPLLVRPKKKGKGFELIAGERRYRSNKIALARAQAASPPDPAKVQLLEKLPCIVREMSDEEAADIQLMENEQRSDLTALERAQGYRNLINTNPTKHSAHTIAQRVGKSPTWVWDIMLLLNLTPEAKALLEAGRMTVNHAIPIARLTPAEQKKVINPNGGGLFAHDHAFDFDTPDGDDGTLLQILGNEKDPYKNFKARSVRELNAWIADHIRFDPKKAAHAAPLLFDSVAEAVETAQKLPGRGKKVIPISYDHQLKDDAKDPNERTYCVSSWRRADGTEGTTPGGYNKPPKDSPTCEHSVLGVVVAGPGYGQAFPVCIARDKCKTHFGEEIKDKEKRQKEAQAIKSGTVKTSSASAPKESAYDKAERERQARWKKEREEASALHLPIKRAALDKLNQLPATLPKPLFELLLKELELPPSTKPNMLAQAIIINRARRTFNYGESPHWVNEQQRWAKALGVNVDAIRAEYFKKVRDEKKVQTTGAAKATGKKSSKKPAKRATKTTPKKTAKKVAARRTAKK